VIRRVDVATNKLLVVPSVPTLVVHGSIVVVPVRENLSPESPPLIPKGYSPNTRQFVVNIRLSCGLRIIGLRLPPCHFASYQALKYSGVPVVLVLADAYAEAATIWREAPGFTSDVGDPI